MKKSIISLVLLLSILSSITACGPKTPPEPNPPAPTVYEVLEELADKEYTSVKLGIVTVTGGIRLAADYVLTKNSVLYSVEQIRKLPTDGDIIDLPTEYKTTLTGTAAVNGGNVVLDGTDVTLPSYEELKGNFDFSEANFTNAVAENGSLKADVVSPAAFCDAGGGIHNMKVAISYSETAFNKITITYQTADSEVTATYEFVG